MRLQSQTCEYESRLVSQSVATT